MPRKKDKYLAEIVVIGGTLLAGLLTLFLSLPAKADYVYEGSQSLYDLQTNSSGSTGLGSNDDSVSAAFDLGFTFTFYGNDYTKARMATNGCLHFNLTGSYCGDYTPDPLPQYTNTLFPFWTDLIKDGGSVMKAKAFDDYTIFGWYNMREYNRANSDNSIEVWLYPNDSYEFRYGGLDIISHDVLIGEQGSTSQLYTYHFFDECSTGTTNVSGTCVNYDWNSSSNAKNTLLEGGGSLFGDGTNQSLCATVPLTSVNCSGYAVAYLAQQCALNSLYDEDCSGYAAAYLTQQCNVTQLYSESCPNYTQAYDDQQCDDDPQYAPFCSGYSQESSVAYYNPNEFDYAQEDMWYDTEYDEWLDPSDPCYENACENFTDADWYALDAEQFGQDTVVEWFGTDVTFGDDGMVNWNTTDLTSYDEVDVLMDVYDIEQEQQHQQEILLEEFTFQETFLAVEDYSEPEVFVEFNTIAELDEWFEEEIELQEELAEAEEELEEIFEEIANLEEAPEEEFIEEIFEEEAVEEVFEAIEERLAEEEILDLEAEEEIFEEELDELEIAEREERGESSMTRKRALSIVNSTIRTANNSFSSATINNSNSSTNTISATNSTGSSGGGISTTSSPSRSDQFASATVQTNTVLSLSSDTGAVSNVSISVTPMPTVDNNPQIVMADVQVTTMDNEIDTAISGVMTSSEADQIADKIIANNIKEQQEEGQATQETTGKYGEEASLVAYMGYVPGFNTYSDAVIPPQTTWYEDKSIYSGAYLPDNITGYYNLAGDSITKMNSMINLQPNL